MRRPHIVGALLGLAITASSAQADPVYVPLALDTVRAGIHWRTQLLVSNQSTESHGFDPYFIPTNTDGAARQGQPPGGVFLDGLHTLFFSDIVQNNSQVGMLELDADPELAISARLQSTNAAGLELLAVDMPVVSDRNLFASGQVAILHGLVRSGNRQTDLGLLNLEDRPLVCSLLLSRADGSTLFGPWETLPVPPRGHRHFQDALGALGQTAIDTVRARISCNGRYYPFAVIFDQLTGEATFITAAAKDSSLTLPGTPVASPTPTSPGSTVPTPTPTPTTPSGPPGSTFTFTRNGVFHKPTLDNQRLRFNFPFPKGLVYRVLTIDMDIKHAGWYSKNPDGIHPLIWIARNEHRSNTFGYVTARGPARNLLILMTNVDFAPGDFSRGTRNASLVPGHTYHLAYRYDTHTGVISAVFTDKADGTKFTVTHPVTARSNSIVTEGNGFVLDVGGVLIHEDVPSLGWEYSNLHLTFAQQ